MKKEQRKTPELRFPGFTDDWEQRKLSEVLSMVKDGTHGTHVDAVDGPLLLSAKNIKNGTIKWDDADRRISIEEYKKIHSKFSLQDGDVLLTIVGSIGETAILRDPEGLTFQRSVAFLRPSDAITSEFLYTEIQTTSFQKELENRKSTSAQPGIYLGDLAEILFSFPVQKDEQEQIGKFFANLDNTITLHQRKLDQMKEYKKGMLQKMFPKKGERVPEIRFPGFADDWEQRKFGDLFSEKREKTKAEDEDVLLSCAINGMFLNSELFDHFRGSSNIGYLKVRLNDLILSAQNLHLGNANVNLRFEHGIISPAYKVYDIIDSDPYFINAWVKKDDTKNFFLAATTEGASQCRKNIEWSTLYNQSLMVPSLEEQQKLGAFFKELDDTITLHQRKLESMKEYKKGLLQKMFV